MPPRAQSRTSRRDAGDGAAQALERIVVAIRRRFGAGKRILVRAPTAGLPASGSWPGARRERTGVTARGRPATRASKRDRGTLSASLRARWTPGDSRVPCRRFTDFTHSTLTSWSRERRVVGKAELTVGGRNPRLVVTNPKAGTFDARRLHEDIHRARGGMVNLTLAL